MGPDASFGLAGGASRLQRIERLARVAMLSALALVLSYLETMIPLPVGVPGIKLGLANVAVLVALFTCDVRTACLVMLVKVLASGFLFGSPMMLAYSAGGTLAAFAVMLALSKVPGVGVVPISMLAAVFHNAGQLAVASAMLSTTAVFLTLPVLALAACVTGFLTGLVAAGVLANSPQGQARPYAFPADRLDVPAGKVTAVVGANGAGKTTLALQMAGLVPDAAAGSAGVVFQNPEDQIVASVVEDDVAFGPENRGLPREDLRSCVDASLARLRIGALAKRETAELSGGEQQQVAIAGLLALGSDALVFDEAAAMLSPGARARFWQQCRELAADGRAVAVVTHSMDDAFACDRVVVVDRGEVLLSASPQELSTRPDLSALFADCGLELPFELQVSAALRERGVDLAAALGVEVLADLVVRRAAGGAR